MVGNVVPSSLASSMICKEYSLLVVEQEQVRQQRIRQQYIASLRRGTDPT